MVGEIIIKVINIKFKNQISVNLCNNNIMLFTEYKFTISNYYCSNLPFSLRTV